VSVDLAAREFTPDGWITWVTVTCDVCASSRTVDRDDQHCQLGEIGWTRDGGLDCCPDCNRLADAR
jgi:hypothetical protein